MDLFRIILYPVLILYVVALIYFIQTQSNGDSLTFKDTPITYQQQDALSDTKYISNYINSSQYLYISIIVLSITTLISVVITFYLYRWRKILLSNQHMLLPEETGKYLENLNNNIVHSHYSMDSNYKNLKEKIMILSKDFGNVSRQTNKQISELADMFLTLHKSLDEKDAEIRKLKKGYEQEIFIKFISRFLRVDQAVKDLIKEMDINTDSLNMIKELLEDALLECNVEIFMPAVGDNYRDAFGVSENPKIIAPEKKEEEFKISEIIEPGYLIKTPEGNEVIIPSKVKIYGEYVA